jgi:hypothetical protein
MDTNCAFEVGERRLCGEELEAYHPFSMNDDSISEFGVSFNWLLNEVQSVNIAHRRDVELAQGILLGPWVIER